MIVDCQLLIADLCAHECRTIQSIGNRQSAIGNRQRYVS